MIIHYIKSILSSWWLNKAFTLLSLVVAAMSMILITCIVTYWSLLISPLAPETNKKNLRFVFNETYSHDEQRTLKYYEAQSYIPPVFYQNDLETQQMPNHTIYSAFGGESYMFYINYKKQSINIHRTDHRFFEIFNFHFLTGEPYSDMQITSQGIPIVITKAVAKKLFGTINCIGKSLQGRALFRVVGVVEKAGPWSLFNQEAFVLENYKNQPDLFRQVAVAFKLEHDKDEAVLIHYLGKLSDNYSNSSESYTYRLSLENFVSAFSRGKNLGFFLDVKFLLPLLILILILPALCIVNLFKGLILEKISELGVRKSFGASTFHIAFQLITESTILSLLAGIISIIFSLFFWHWVFQVEFEIVLRDVFNLRSAFILIMVYCLLGMLFGYFTALKLAKGNIVSYLSNHQN